MGCRADSVPCVVYIGPWIVEGGTILYTPDLALSTWNPNRISSDRTFFIVDDWCCRGMSIISPYMSCLLRRYNYISCIPCEQLVGQIMTARIPLLKQGLNCGDSRLIEKNKKACYIPQGIHNNA
jgi:hypothetical protein